MTKNQQTSAIVVGATALVAIIAFYFLTQYRKTSSRILSNNFADGGTSPSSSITDLFLPRGQFSPRTGLFSDWVPRRATLPSGEVRDLPTGTAPIPGECVTLPSTIGGTTTVCYGGRA